MKTANEIFEAELARRGVSYSPTDEKDVYLVQTPDGEKTICTENIGRNYLRDSDPNAIANFVEQILKPFTMPEWSDASKRVFYSAEPNDYDFIEFIKYEVSDDVVKIPVYINQDEGCISWINEKQLETWNIDKTTLENAIDTNMAALLTDADLEVNEIDGLQCGMIPISPIFKASIIFAPNFKEYITSKLSWPVLAVIPCRDFIFVVPKEHDALLNRMGTVVLREYNNSGYPITTEILLISDEGIRAVGKYSDPNN